MLLEEKKNLMINLDGSTDNKFKLLLKYMSKYNPSFIN